MLDWFQRSLRIKQVILNHSQRIKKLGDVGEYLIKDIGVQNNRKVEMSEDSHDSVKDMLIDNIETEVKTLTRIKNKEAFFLADQQLKKCLSVDRLIFVEIPLYLDFPIDIFESTKPRKTVPHYFVKPWGDAHGLLFPLTNMSYIGSIDNKDIVAKMRELSPSGHLDNKPELKDKVRADRLELISKLPRSFI
jgi:hypothetical protein